MTRHRSSSPDQWTNPRPWQDASARLHKHGPVRPMIEGRTGIPARAWVYLIITAAALSVAIFPALGGN